MFSHLDDPNPPSPGAALADRVRAEGRRRRVRRVRLMGGACAVLTLAVSAAVVRPWSGEQQGVVSNAPSSTASTTTEPHEATEPTTSSTSLDPAPEVTANTPSTEHPPAAGSLASATAAVRAACREFYYLDPANLDERLTAEELAAQCDESPIEWRSDCYHQRPTQFVPGDGGCAHLGGYLAIWLGRQPYEAGDVFEIDNDEWHVIPESD